MSSKDWVTNFVDRQLFDLRLLVLEWDCKTPVGCVGGGEKLHSEQCTCISLVSSKDSDWEQATKLRW